MFIYIPAWLLIVGGIYSIGFILTYLLLLLLTINDPGDIGEFFPLSLMWPLTFPALIIGIVFGIIEKISNMLK